MLMARSLMSSSPGHLLPTDRQLLTMPCRPCFVCPDSAKDQGAAIEGQRYARRAASYLVRAPHDQGLTAVSRVGLGRGAGGGRCAGWASVDATTACWATACSQGW